MDNLLIHADSERNSDQYYATGFRAGDPFTYFRARGRDHLLIGDLEFGRAKKQSKVDRVLLTTEISDALKSKKKPNTPPDVIAEALRRNGATRVFVPASFPLKLAQELSKRGIHLSVRPDPFLLKRLVKRPDEIRHITHAVRVTESAIGLAASLLRRSKIRGNRLVLRGRALTAEYVRTEMHLYFMRNGYLANETIIACGDQACDPHDRGSGPLRPNRSIVFDVFPRSAHTLYWADVSRTFVKGRPSEGLRRLYGAVRDAQDVGCKSLRAGVTGKSVHEKVAASLVDAGYKTERRNGSFVGFFHGTGHGLGLDIHEPPGVGKSGGKLPAGTVVTVEPGLYYPGLGGVRLEDDVVVTRTGHRNLTRYPRNFVIP